MTSVEQAVERAQNGPGQLIQSYKADFAAVMPSHIKPETWVRLAQGLLRRDKNLARIAQQNPASLMQALLECARLGHEPGSDAFFLVPMGGDVEGWESYRGIVERIFRAGAVSSVKAELVRQNDHFEYDPGVHERPIHKVDWFKGDRGEILGAYSYAIMVDGSTSRVVVIDMDYIGKVRAESRGSDKASSPWVKWPEQMILKTVLRRLEPFVPTSTEWRKEQLRAAMEVSALQGPQRPAGVAVPQVHPEPDGVVDAELVDVETGEISADVSVEDPPEGEGGLFDEGERQESPQARARRLARQAGGNR